MSYYLSKRSRLPHVRFKPYVPGDKRRDLHETGNAGAKLTAGIRRWRKQVTG